MHVDDGTLQSHLDGELTATETARLREHLADCPACETRRARLAGEQAEMEALLAHLDGPGAPAEPHPLPSLRPPRAQSRAAWAATVVLALGVAGAAWAAPGSPVPGWLATLRGRAEVEGTRDGAPPSAQLEGGGGIRMQGSDLLIDFELQTSGGQLQIRETADSLVSVVAVTGQASFTDSADGRRLRVASLAGRADFQVEVPEGAAGVEIRVGGETVFLKQGRSVTSVTSPDSLGVRVIPLGGPPR